MRYFISLLTLVSFSLGAAEQDSADWPSWRGDGSGSTRSGAVMVDSLDQAKQAWQSDPIGLSGCMYPSGQPGTGWCDPVIAEGRVFIYHFRRSGTDLVDTHFCKGKWLSLVEPPDSPAAFTRNVGLRSKLPSKQMSELQRHVRADDIIDCFDDRTGKTLWRRVFPQRGINHVRVYSPLCVPCVKDGVIYALGSAGRVYALDVATGKTIWESDIGKRHAELDQAAEAFSVSRHRCNSIECPLNTSVVYADGVVAMGQGKILQGRKPLYAMVGLDATTGKLLWTIPDCLGPYGSPSVWRHQGKEYILIADKRMKLVEPKTGKVLWSVGSAHKPVTENCAPAVKGDFVVVNKNITKVGGKNIADWMRGPTCYRISPTGAELLWSMSLKNTGNSITLIAPVIDGDHAYVPVSKGVIAVELKTGKMVEQQHVPGFSGAYAGYAMGNGLLFNMGKGKEIIRAAKAFPDMKVLGGVLPGNADKGEIQTPATANGRVYWRGKRSIWCYDFRKNPPPPSDKILPTARDLSAIGDDPVKLAEVVVKEEWPTRAMAADRLRVLGPQAKPVVKALQGVLLTGITAKDWGDVDLLIGTLNAIDPAATAPAAPELAKLLTDDDERIVRLACHGLAQMGPFAQAAGPALAVLLDPERPQLAACAARALGKIGHAASSAAPGLLQVLNSDDPRLAFEASRALCRVAPAEPATHLAAIEAVIAHPWYAHLGQASPRLGSGRTITLAYLGKSAVPQLLTKAKVLSHMKPKIEKDRKLIRMNDFTPLAELAAAAFMIDPATAKDFMPLLAKVPQGNPHQVHYDRQLMKWAKEDLRKAILKENEHAEAKQKPSE